MARYVRPRLVVEAIQLTPALTEKLGLRGVGGYLVTKPGGVQSIESIDAFEREFHLLVRKSSPVVVRKTRGPDRKPRRRQNIVEVFAHPPLVIR